MPSWELELYQSTMSRTVTVHRHQIDLKLQAAPGNDAIRGSAWKPTPSWLVAVFSSFPDCDRSVSDRWSRAQPHFVIDQENAAAVMHAAAD
jgi:hypothetical protein